MIKVELKAGGFIICKGVSSDPMFDDRLILQLGKGRFKYRKTSEIKHISSYENQIQS